MNRGGVSVYIQNKFVYLVKYIIKECADCIFLILDLAVAKSKPKHITMLHICAPQYSTFYEYVHVHVDGILRFENILLEILSTYGDMYIIISGDINARNGNIKDYIGNDDLSHMDLGNLYVGSNFNKPRLSQDSEINMLGKSLIQLCKTYSIHILNGRIAPDITGSYIMFHPQCRKQFG